MTRNFVSQLVAGWMGQITKSKMKYYLLIFVSKMTCPILFNISLFQSTLTPVSHFRWLLIVCN
jgi:hypothetical protein